MGDQLNYLNNLNRPNLVDITLLQKINDGYSYSSQPKVSHFYNMIQTAGSMTCSIAKDNIFISVIVIFLFLFLAWCYIEKQRQDVLTEKYLQKKLAKSLLNDELNLFSEVPSPLNVEKLFNDIKTDLFVVKESKININNEEDIQNIETMNQQSLSGNINSPNQERPVHMTKREQNIQSFEKNQNNGVGYTPNTNQFGAISSNQIESQNMGINQYPSQGYPKGAARDFGQEFVQQAPTIIQSQPPQPAMQQQQQPTMQQQQQQQQQQQPDMQRQQQEQQNQPQPIGGPVGSSRYMDISNGFNKNSYMLM
jgi:hypothetical protein